MPPKTGVPTARAEGAGPGRDDQRHQAEDEGETGHHDRPEAQARARRRGLGDRLAAAPLPLPGGKLDDQDAVLGRQGDQHHERWLSRLR